jgi:hypothetical protein
MYMYIYIQIYIIHIYIYIYVYIFIHIYIYPNNAEADKAINIHFVPVCICFSCFIFPPLPNLTSAYVYRLLYIYMWVRGAGVRVLAEARCDFNKSQ